MQDDVPPVSGAEAVDSERARNLEEVGLWRGARQASIR